jgi:hypothetical protein
MNIIKMIVSPHDEITVTAAHNGRRHGHGNAICSDYLLRFMGILFSIIVFGMWQKHELSQSILSILVLAVSGRTILRDEV